MASLGEAWNAFKERWPSYTGFVFLYMMITGLAIVYAVMGVASDFIKAGGLHNPAASPMLLISVIPEIIGLFLVSWLMGALMDNAGIYLALHPKTGFEKTLKEAGKLIWQRIIADIIYGLIMAVVVGIPVVVVVEAALSGGLTSTGIVLSVVAVSLLWFLVWLAFFPYKYLVVKRGDGVSAITESLGMIRKNPGRVIATALVIMILSLVIYAISGLIVGAAGTVVLIFAVKPWLEWIYYTTKLDEIA